MQLEENFVLFSSPVVNGITFHFMNPPVHVLCFSSRGNMANGPTRPSSRSKSKKVGFRFHSYRFHCMFYKGRYVGKNLVKKISINNIF